MIPIIYPNPRSSKRKTVSNFRSLSRMAGAIARNFNNQLQAAMMNLEFAMEQMPRDGGLIEPLSAAMGALRKGAEVSTLMLTYVGQTPAKREPLDLSEVRQRSRHGRKQARSGKRFPGLIADVGESRAPEADPSGAASEKVAQRHGAGGG